MFIFGFANNLYQFRFVKISTIYQRNFSINSTQILLHSSQKQRYHTKKHMRTKTNTHKLINSQKYWFWRISKALNLLFSTEYINNSDFTRDGQTWKFVYPMLRLYNCIQITVITMAYWSKNIFYMFPDVFRTRISTYFENWFYIF